VVFESLENKMELEELNLGQLAAKAVIERLEKIVKTRVYQIMRPALFRSFPDLSFPDIYIPDLRLNFYNPDFPPEKPEEVYQDAICNLEKDRDKTNDFKLLNNEANRLLKTANLVLDFGRDMVEVRKIQVIANFMPDFSYRKRDFGFGSLEKKYLRKFVGLPEERYIHEVGELLNK
jgi:hypothetical protein